MISVCPRPHEDRNTVACFDLGIHRVRSFGTNGNRAAAEGDEKGKFSLYPSYYERLARGLRQIMSGSRKFSPEHISRDDLAALTREAADISGIQYVMDTAKAQVDEILN